MYRLKVINEIKINIGKNVKWWLYLFWLWGVEGDLGRIVLSGVMKVWFLFNI